MPAAIRGITTSILQEVEADAIAAEVCFALGVENVNAFLSTGVGFVFALSFLELIQETKYVLAHGDLPRPISTTHPTVAERSLLIALRFADFWKAAGLPRERPIDDCAKALAIATAVSEQARRLNLLAHQSGVRPR